MYITRSLIPARFLSLIAHLCIIVSLLWNSQETTIACLPVKVSPPLLQLQHTQLVVGFSVALGLIGIELLTFLSGVTFFNSTSALISIGGHACASILLTYFLLDSWQCSWYWWIFALCSVVPTLTDMWTVFTVIRKSY